MLKAYKLKLENERLDIKKRALEISLVGTISNVEKTEKFAAMYPSHEHDFIMSCLREGSDTEEIITAWGNTLSGKVQQIVHHWYDIQRAILGLEKVM